MDRRFAFGDAEREQFVHWMQADAQFCGVRVLTYCVMSNHFHLEEARFIATGATDPREP